MKIEMKSGPLHFALAFVSNISIAFGFGLLIYQHFFLLDVAKINDYVGGGILLMVFGLVGWLTVIFYGRSLIIEDGKIVVRNYFKKVIFECLLIEIDKVELTGLLNINVFSRGKGFKISSDLVFTNTNELLERTQTKRVGLYRDIFILHDYLKEVVELN